MGFAQVKKFFVYTLCCRPEPERPLQIGHPTNFRREEINIGGLTAEEQSFVREKARSDAARLHAGIPIDSTALSLLGQEPVMSTSALPQRKIFRNRLSAFIPPLKYHPINTKIDLGLVRTESQERDNKGAFELERYNQSRDSITLRGSDVMDSDK